MDLQHRLTKILYPYKKDQFLLSISGGMDSMALLTLFNHFKNHFSFQIKVVHIHHGPSKDKAQENFRFQAWSLVRDFCLQADIDFFSNYEGRDREEFLSQFSEALSSEEDFRKFRQAFIESLSLEVKWDWVVKAHHQEDLLETRIMRMIRGVGPGGLSSMTLEKEDVLRPFLEFSKADLKKYLVFKKVNWVDDPSNQSSDYFRNWMRNDWLPQLEEMRPGSLNSFARSLDLILGSLKDHSAAFSCIKEDEIQISEFLLLSYELKSQALATYMKDQGLKNYGVSHIKEVLKRLDSDKKRHTFQLLGRSWLVDAGRLKVLRLGSIEPV